MPTFVSLSFDDTLESQFQAGAALRSRGMLGTFYVNSTRIGKPGSMTLEQLRSLASDGHEIGGHTLNHLHLTTVDDGEQRRQVCSDRARLIDLGFDVHSFAYPGGMQNAAVRAVISDCGYRSGRLINGGTETVPCADPFALRVVAHTGPSSTLATMQSWVTKAEATGGFVAIVFHGMCATCSPDPMEMGLFEQFLDWLATRRARGTVVRTVNEMVGGSVAPAVWGPIPPPAEDGPNLLRNPSLEADANADDAPDCWVRGTPGSVSAWSGSNDAYDGVASQYLGAPFGGSYTDRRVNTVQDSGYCAPPIVPMRTYRISAYYKGSSRAALNAYYRDTDGFWQAWMGSPTFKASATWERATFTLPPAPANAEAIGMGIVASDAKELWVDAFTLEEVVVP